MSHGEPVPADMDPACTHPFTHWVPDNTGLEWHRCRRCGAPVSALDDGSSPTPEWEECQQDCDLCEYEETP